MPFFHPDPNPPTSSQEGLLQKPPLHWASSLGHAWAARILLLGGSFDVNTTDENEETALHLAATNGHDGVARVLIHSHADVEAKSSKDPVRSDAFAIVSVLPLIFRLGISRLAVAKGTAAPRCFPRACVCGKGADRGGQGCC